MSEEDVKAFFVKLGGDKELQEKVKAADTEEKIFAIAKASGHNFSKNEYDAFIAAHPPQHPEGELTESEMSEVSGGSIVVCAAAFIVSVAVLDIAIEVDQAMRSDP